MNIGISIHTGDGHETVKTGKKPTSRNSRKFQAVKAAFAVVPRLANLRGYHKHPCMEQKTNFARKGKARMNKRRIVEGCAS
jgi:hypothetical protein